MQRLAKEAKHLFRSPLFPKLTLWMRHPFHPPRRAWRLHNRRTRHLVLPHLETTCLLQSTLIAARTPHLHQDPIHLARGHIPQHLTTTTTIVLFAKTTISRRIITVASSVRINDLISPTIGARSVTVHI